MKHQQKRHQEIRVPYDGVKVQIPKWLYDDLLLIAKVKGESVDELVTWAVIDEYDPGDA